jgi:hypothetical protein
MVRLTVKFLFAAGFKTLAFSQEKVQHPAALWVPSFVEVLGEVWVASFEQGVVKGERTGFAIVKGVSQLNDGRGKLSRRGIGLKKVPGHVPKQHGKPSSLRSPNR